MKRHDWKHYLRYVGGKKSWPPFRLTLTCMKVRRTSASAITWVTRRGTWWTRVPGWPGSTTRAARSHTRMSGLTSPSGAGPRTTTTCLWRRPSCWRCSVPCSSFCRQTTPASSLSVRKSVFSGDNWNVDSVLESHMEEQLVMADLRFPRWGCQPLSFWRKLIITVRNVVAAR